jgi:hypothetical protein
MRKINLWIGLLLTVGSFQAVEAADAREIAEEEDVAEALKALAGLDAEESRSAAPVDMMSSMCLSRHVSSALSTSADGGVSPDVLAVMGSLTTDNIRAMSGDDLRALVLLTLGARGDAPSDSDVETLVEAVLRHVSDK